MRKIILLLKLTKAEANEDYCMVAVILMPEGKPWNPKLTLYYSLLPLYAY